MLSRIWQLFRKTQVNAPTLTEKLLEQANQTIEKNALNAVDDFI